MRIICTPQEYRDLNDVIVAGCCWIGSGEGKKLSNGKKNEKVDIKKFEMATSLIYKKGKKIIDWEFVNK